MNKILQLLLVLLLVTMLGGCPGGSDNDSTADIGGDSSDDVGGGDSPDDGTGGGISGTLVLQTADRPDVAPCPLQDILIDAAAMSDLKTALQSGTLIYLDVPFNGADSDIYSKKCGLDSFWNPAQNSDEITLSSIGIDPAGSPNITDLVLFGNAGICASGFNNSSFGVGEGFPVAGTYRKEIKAAHQGLTYHLRFRALVSGSSAGNTFASEGITPSTGLSTLVYRVDGVETPHDTVFSALLTAMTAATDNAPGATIEVRKTVTGPVIFTALIEVICVSSS
ncbi:MAG: hypothetical protein KZQ91_19290 [Candidatus Thiodiazotropha sp. (ex Lucinoma borealis)]|nr:hypothetical protein [Candidatus Thiodiazotropha sp. (ex Lucinoma borealis)]